MKISTQIRYGVRALCDIAYNGNEGPTQVRAIAERTGLPPRYVEQIFQKFKKAGIIKSPRGPFGGYFLARPASDIKIGDIIRAVDGGDIRFVYCAGKKPPLSQRCENFDVCVTREVWEEASAKLMEYFDSVSIERLCEDAKCRGDSLRKGAPIKA